MKRRSLTRVTIGIPAHNEENNIAYLLNSILKQKVLSYKLEKIIVMCDGCTDQTLAKVRTIAKDHPLIRAIDGKKQLGKKNRLMQLYKLNTSDILVICDGDIVMSEPYVIEKMIACFNNKSVVVVGGNNVPIPAKTLIGKLARKWHRVWYEARVSINNGNNIYNIRGCIMALRRSFSQKIKFQKEIISDAQFIYFLALKEKLKFRFAKDAVIFTQVPESVNDYLLQNHRTIRQKQKMAKFFGNWIYNEYQIPKIAKIKALLKTIISEPIITVPAFLLYIFIRFFPYRKETIDRDGLWKRVESTKRGISILNF